MLFSGVSSDSTTIFLSNSDKVLEFEEITELTFQSGMTDLPSDDHNTLFTATPEILSLKVVQVTNDEMDTIAITFETSMRVYADTVLTGDDYFSSIRFGPYWYSDTSRNFEYLFELQGIFPKMFAADGSFQIGFSVAEAIAKPSQPTSPPSTTPTPQPTAIVLPTAETNVEPVGVQQYIRVNATVEFMDVVSDSRTRFWRDPEKVTVFERLTQKTFEAGIADPLPNQNTLFNAPPEILSLQVNKVTNPSESSIAISFTTTMRIHVDAKLTDAQFLVDIKFGHYFYSDPDRSSDYLNDVTRLYPLMFAKDAGYFQINFETAKATRDPTAKTSTAAPEVSQDTATLSAPLSSGAFATRSVSPLASASCLTGLLFAALAMH